MVAKIKSGKSLIGALNYNENKVRSGKAELLGAIGYAKDHGLLSFRDKLLRLTDLAARNQLTKTNTVHISLNFDNSEHLERDQLIAIAEDYMEGIGFGNQPFLIYRHIDAGHPHLHLVSTSIDHGGERISLHNIGRERSETTRRAVELKYGLVQADSRQGKNQHVFPQEINPLDYGKTELKRAVTNIVNEVTKTYKFTSLLELNAILRAYNITADRGSKASVMYRNNGVLYWALDDKGNKQGVPIKASSIYQKPTLKVLEKRFRLNEFLRKPDKENLKAKIDQALRRAHSLDDLKVILRDKGIQLLLRQNGDGRIYGLTFIDHSGKVVFNGSDLGKTYSAAGILNAIGNNPPAIVPPSLDTGMDRGSGVATRPLFESGRMSASKGLLEELLNPYEAHSPVPYPLEQKKKKKRKKLNL